jgi:hypothetical protein
MIAIPRGKYLGKASERSAEGEAEHFIGCLACGGWMDCRDLGHVLEHEGPLPHPPQAANPQILGYFRIKPETTELEKPRKPRIAPNVPLEPTMPIAI